MSLKERLFDELKESMKSRDTVKKDIIQMVRAGILQVEKDSKEVLDDSGVTSVVAKELKKLNDVLPDYIKSGRQDKIDEIKRKIEILKSYLPEQLTEAEIQKVVSEAITSVGATSMKDMGAVMKTVTEKVKGAADNKVVSEIVRKTLQSI